MTAYSPDPDRAPRPPLAVIVGAVIFGLTAVALLVAWGGLAVTVASIVAENLPSRP